MEGFRPNGAPLFVEVVSAIRHDEAVIEAEAASIIVGNPVGAFALNVARSYY